MKPRGHRSISAPTLVVALLLLCPAAGLAAWFGSVEVGAGYDDNISRAELPSDIKSDYLARVALDGGRAWELENGKGLNLTGSLAYTGHDEFDGLDNLALGLTGTFRKKFGLGAEAPRLRLVGTIERLDYDARNRDGWFYLGEIRYGKRLSDRWGLEQSFIIMGAGLLFLCALVLIWVGCTRREPIE